VVRVTSTVVANRGSDGLRNGDDVSQQLLDRPAREIGVPVQRVVEVGHIRLMVLPMVDLHGAGIDVRLERVVRVPEIGKGMHRLAPPASAS
jgi:hypothetical protein